MKINVPEGIPAKKPEQDVEFIIPMDEWTPSVRKSVRYLQKEIKRMENHIYEQSVEICKLTIERDDLQRENNRLKYLASKDEKIIVNVQSSELITDESDISKLIDIIHKMVQ